MRADARKRPPILVGMTGKKRSGKDSFAATLVEEFGFTRFAFADPLREACLGLDPIVSTVLRHDAFGAFEGATAHGVRLSEHVGSVGWEAAKEIPEVRRTLQNYGVAIREIDPGFWVRTTMSKALANPGPAVITDVRFPNEVDAVREAGGKVVRVTRPGLTQTDTHVSETALDDVAVDFEIENGGTLDDLAGWARHLADVALGL